MGELSHTGHRSRQVFISLLAAEAAQPTQWLRMLRPRHPPEGSPMPAPEPSSALSPELSEKSRRLADSLASLPRAQVAFSGGVDSTYLLLMAHQALGDRVVAVTADSPSLARSTLAEACAFCRDRGIAHRVVATGEFANPAYLANDGQRCYHCKSSLLEALSALDDCSPALIGAITDDLGDHRPGMQAARERQARFPLIEANLSKADVRALSKALGLATWDRPAEPCLSSRVPYGEPVTIAGLGMIEQAEAALRFHGFATCRARHHQVGGSGPTATGHLCRLEVPDADIPRLVELRSVLVPALKRLGYAQVTVDLAGFASGGLNKLLP